MYSLVSHVEYVPHALLRLEKKETDRQTDGRTPNRYITLRARRGQLNERFSVLFAYYSEFGEWHSDIRAW